MRYTKKSEVWKLTSGYLVFTCLTLWPQLGAEMYTTCPSVCTCTVGTENSATEVEHSKHVVCSGVVNDLRQLDLPKKTRWLDLSDISLQSIPSYYFIDHGMFELSELDLSNNNLSKIDHDTFIGLNNLQYLDLSHNKIIYFDPGCLIYNELLTHIYLRGTDIPIPTDTSLLVSRTLKLLDISDCGIRELPNLIFSELPYLVVLNISRNPIEQVNVKIMDNVSWLRELDITQTNMKCDKNFQPLSEWGKTFSVKITGYPCLNSHSQQGIDWFRSNRQKPTTAEGSEWSDFTEEGSLEAAIDEKDVADVDNEGVEDEEMSADSGENESSGFTDFGTPEPTNNEEEMDWAEFLPRVHWTIWLACGGGFALGVALTFGAGAAIYACCKSPEEEPNELVFAGEEFQLVHAPNCEPPIIPDEPPSYSSLFSSRYQKVLPTGPSLYGHRR